MRDRGLRARGRCRRASRATSSARAPSSACAARGEEGLGEDVTYDAVDHEILQARRPGAARWRARTRSPPSASTSRALDRCSPSRRSARSRSATARGRTSRPRSTSRCARPGTTLHAALGREPAAGALRRLAAPRRAADARAAAPRACELYPTLRFKLDPTSSWDERLIAELRRDRRGRLGRLQGLLRRARSSISPADPVLYRRVVRGVPARRGSRTRRSPRETDAVLRRAPRALLLGRADPLDRGHRGAAVPAADGQHQALAPGRPAQPARRLRLLRRRTASATTAAASSSSASGAARSSTWPRCSTPTPPTTSRRRGFNLPEPPAGPARRARCRRRPRRAAFAGADATSAARLALRGAERLSSAAAQLARRNFARRSEADVSGGRYRSQRDRSPICAGARSDALAAATARAARALAAPLRGAGGRRQPGRRERTAPAARRQRDSADRRQPSRRPARTSTTVRITSVQLRAREPLQRATRTRSRTHGTLLLARQRA